ncbi:MAG: hypothetical protein KVP17_001853 [Porospora cf. gigantea B]|uniref:uncharacterized protein n=1 Tax=Porospora cf. gigantea B TaxID=2853592 RepID=UPI003571E008|nr:MAG: hypothetical protein KVP17_001853 [Porospora cf. gigantea B]
MSSFLPCSSGPFSSARGRVAAVSVVESEPPDSVSVNPRKKPKIDANPSLELVAVFEDKPRQTIGVAALSFRTAEVALHEFVDMSSYLFTLSVLRQYDPVRVVLPRLAVGSNALCNRLTSLYADNMTSVEEVHRKYFDVAAGEEIVGHHDLRGDATMATCALAALAAVVRFTEFHQDSVVLSHHLHIAFKSPTDSLFMNLSTVEHLELVMPRGTRGASVAGLFSCRTTSGTDLLRLSLLGPPTDRHVALGRQQLVTYFLEAGHVAARLRALLPKLQSLDSVGAQFVIRPQRKDEAYYRRFIRNAMELHESLLVCRELRELLTEEDSEGSVVSVARKPALLCDAAAAMDPQSLHQITGFLASSLDTNCATNSISQILHVVLPGRNTFLDATRAKYLQILDDLNFYVDGLKSKYQLLQIKLENSDSRGYYFSCPYNPNYTLPADFTWQTCKGSKVTFSTEALDVGGSTALM